LGIDEETQEIVASVVTTNEVHDAQAFKDLLDQVEEPIHQVSAVLMIVLNVTNKHSSGILFQ
jgi:hypothetical protein